MQQTNKTSAIILGVSLFLGLAVLGFLLGNAAIKVKQFERTVVVKGLSEREYKANIVIWPLRFTISGNNIGKIYSGIEKSAETTKKFLTTKGISEKEITFSAPQIIDKFAQQYGSARPEFRYTAYQTLTIYSRNVDLFRSVMSSLSELGKKGIVFTGDDYMLRPEYIFTRLNKIKPAMIEEATRNARKVAEKFAKDSHSKLGKIKRA